MEITRSSCSCGSIARPGAACLAQVEDGDAHPPEDCNPLVALGLVVGEAVDLVVQPVLVAGGDRKHVGPPSLQSNCKQFQRHFRQHDWGGALAPVAARVSGGLGQSENAMLNGAHSAYRSGVVRRCLERESSARFPVAGPRRALPVLVARPVLAGHRCVSRAQGRFRAIQGRGVARCAALRGVGDLLGDGGQGDPTVLISVLHRACTLSWEGFKEKKVMCVWGGVFITAGQRCLRCHPVLQHDLPVVNNL
jgi:hypothetical protein